MTLFTCSMFIVVRIQKCIKYSEWHETMLLLCTICTMQHSICGPQELQQRAHFHSVWYLLDLILKHWLNTQSKWEMGEKQTRMAYVLVHTSHIFGFGFNLWMRRKSSSISEKDSLIGGTVFTFHLEPSNCHPHNVDRPQNIMYGLKPIALRRKMSLNQ